MSDPVEWQVRLVENAAKRLACAARAVAAHAEAIAAAGQAIGVALNSGNKVLVAGNGGSAACAQHFAAEFTGKLALDRPALPAIALSTDTSALTAIANDWGYEEVFSRQVYAHGKSGDVFVGLSTSGTSKNVAAALEAAAELGLTTIALTGPNNHLGGEHEVKVAVRETARVQEIHDLVLHELAQIAERVAFPAMGDDASADRFDFLLDASDLPAFRKWCTESKQTIVTTNGVFDLLHEGHLSSLARARQFGDQLVVFLNSDDSVRRLKGSERPINDEGLRVRDLRRSGLVDHVVVMPQDDPRELLQGIRTDVHTKGAEYATRPMPERELIESLGGRVELLSLVPDLSTSNLVERIAAR